MQTPIVTRYTIRNHSGVRLRAAVVADLHDQDGKVVLKILRQERPEVILIPGDLLERCAAPLGVVLRDDWEQHHNTKRLLAERWLAHLLGALRPARPAGAGEGLRFLREAAQIAPVYLSVGNHECYLQAQDYLDIAEAGGILLDNRSKLFYTGDGVPVALGGLSTRPDLNWLEEYSRGEGYKLLLCHHPEYYAQFVRNTGVDLAVSGHAHGGQIRLFGRGIYAPGQGLWPRYTKGVYEGRLVVSAGLHNNGGIPRWGNPTEVVLLTLVPDIKCK